MAGIRAAAGGMAANAENLMHTGWIKRTVARFGLVTRLKRAVSSNGNDRHRFREEMKEKNLRLIRPRKRLEEKDREIESLKAKLGEGGAGVRAEGIVWIFGTGRSGTSWLASMLGEAAGGAVWSEPLVGLLFGDFYYLRGGEKRGAKFVMGPRHKNVWLKNVRDMILDGAAVRHAGIPEGGGSSSRSRTAR